MALIYKITNNINGKVYIGQTIQSLQHRWKEHLNSSSMDRSKHLPLYQAMNKYGKENFSISIVENCTVEHLNEKEIYYINFFNSFISSPNSNGYNCTLGGEGYRRVEHLPIINKYLELQNIAEVCKITGHSKSTIKRILKTNNIPIKSLQEVLANKKLKKETKKINIKNKNIAQYTLNNDFIQNFNSISQAAQWLIDNNYSSTQLRSISSMIGKVCNNIKPTAYGFKWKEI